MPEYLTPGVYVEEVKTGPKPIEGVSTSTAGFVGETERGPARPQLVTSWQEYSSWFGGYVDAAPSPKTNCFLPYAVEGFFQNGGQRLFVARVIGDGAAAASLELPGDPGPTRIVANGKGAWGNNIAIAVRKASVAGFRIIVLYYRGGVPTKFVDPTDPNELANPARVAPDVVEVFDNLSDDRTHSNFVRTAINGASRLIEVRECLGGPRPVEFEDSRLANGTYEPAVRDNYLDANTKDPALRTGLAGLNEIREISIVAIPDEVAPGLAQLGGDLADACEAMRDRFAVLVHHPDGDVMQNIKPLRDTSFGATYYPWVRVAAPHARDGYRTVPAHGHIAGIYARTDTEQGVHKAPANELVRGLFAREPLSRTLSKTDQDILNPRGVNVIRDFSAERRGVRVWGGRTMSSDPMWKYVNVRRLLIFIERSIEQGTQWVVFEPNAEPTWASIRGSVTNFLTTVWRTGALMGSTADEAFFVRCDRTTMTQNDLDNGRLVCLIGIAPIKPAEFVIFRISQNTMEAKP